MATARELFNNNIECVIYERNSTLGGVWSDGYLNFGVQVQKELYEFPDQPLPEDVPSFTPGQVMHKYLGDFACHYNIIRHIKFNTVVTHVCEIRGPGTRWMVTTQSNGREKKDEFDVVVICIGLYSNVPNMPIFPNQSKFTGKVIHNSKLKSTQQLAGKKVAIIGYGKGATDAAIESAASADQTHIIFREPHWPIPRKLAGILPFKWGLLHRLNSTLIPPYQYQTPVEKCVHGPGKPLVWLYWRLVEALLYCQCQLGSDFGKRVSLVPDTPIEIDAFGESTMVPKGVFFRCARNNRIRLHRTTIEQYTSTGLKLTDGNDLDIDLVIMATGWATDFSFLDVDVWQQLNPADDGFYLYRHMVNPNVPNLAFVGRASSVSSILTYSLQAV